jgi:hypothetical protein
MSKVFDRAMFKAENQPLKADSGIMQGFDDEGEIPEDEMMEEVSQRKPNSPEILMNNLRGDMRSVDARYQELADMVGEDVASETPPEVLALLQSQLAQQSMGIGALPPGQGVPPPPMPAGAPPMPTPDMMGGMPQPGAMPQGPEGQMPQGFAFGGLVGRLGPMINNAAQQVAAAPAPAPDPAVIEQQRRDYAFKNPYVTQQAPAGTPGLGGMFSKIFSQMNPALKTGRPGLNPEFAPEFARRFNRGPGPQVPTQQQTLVPTPQFAEGGIASLGNFSEGVSQAGRNGDTVLAHITPEQNEYLTQLGGGATVNPETGLPEHFISAIPAMASNMAARFAPMAQQANVLAGRMLYNPTFTAPTLNQTRTTLGTFGPKVAEGMDVVYPTFTQGIANSRVGQMAGQVADKVGNMPAWGKLSAAALSVPGGTYIADMFDNPNMVPGNQNAPKVPGDPATGWKPEEEAPQATPVNWNKVPVSTGADQEPPASTTQFIENNLNKKPAQATLDNRLEAYMKENLPVFEKYMGTGNTQDFNQAQALFLLADMGLKLAGSRKRGESFVGSLARSAEGLPSGLATIAAQEEANKRQVRGAALTAGLQSIAAEDKAAAALQAKMFDAYQKGQKVDATDIGEGMFQVKDYQGRPQGYMVAPEVKDDFAKSPLVPMAKTEDGKSYVITNPYATVKPSTVMQVRDKDQRTKMGGEKTQAFDMVDKTDRIFDSLKDVYGPGAWALDKKNNALASFMPDWVVSPDVDLAKKKSEINTYFTDLENALVHKSGDKNIAVKEREFIRKKLGDTSPGAFFKDYELVMGNLAAIRTAFLNDGMRKSAQLGHTDYDIQFTTPNLGTRNDPIPQDKMAYLKPLATQNPNGQVYIKYGKTVEPVLLSTIKE